MVKEKHQSSCSGDLDDDAEAVMFLVFFCSFTMQAYALQLAFILKCHRSRRYNCVIKPPKIIISIFQIALSL